MKIILRSFSKSYSAAGLRLGMAFADESIIKYLKKAQSLYSVNRITQAMGIAILNNRQLFCPLIRQITDQREATFNALSDLGFQCVSSNANFIFVKVPIGKSEDWYRQLKERKILVRQFPGEGLDEYLRITIGKPDDMENLFSEMANISFVFTRGSLSRPGSSGSPQTAPTQGGL